MDAFDEFKMNRTLSIVFFFGRGGVILYIFLANHIVYLRTDFLVRALQMPFLTLKK